MGRKTEKGKGDVYACFRQVHNRYVRKKKSKNNSLGSYYLTTNFYVPNTNRKGLRENMRREGSSQTRKSPTKTRIR